MMKFVNQFSFTASAYPIIFFRQLHLYIVKDMNTFQQLYQKWNKDIDETEKDTKSEDLWLIYSNQTAILDTSKNLESFTPVQLRLDSLVFLFYVDRKGILKDVCNKLIQYSNVF